MGVKMATELDIRGFRVLKSCLDRTAQEELVTELRAILKLAPLFSPVTPSGRQRDAGRQNGINLAWLGGCGGDGRGRKA